MTARNHRRHPGTAFSSNSDAFDWQLQPANCSPYNRTGRPVRAENLVSLILVTETAENRSRRDGAEPLNRPMNGSVLAQLSLPEIKSGRIDGAIRPGSVRRPRTSRASTQYGS